MVKVDINNRSKIEQNSISLPNKEKIIQTTQSQVYSILTKMSLQQKSNNPCLAAVPATQKLIL